MNSDSEQAHCPACDIQLTDESRRARGGWDRSPGGDEFGDEIHCCAQCGAWSIVTFVDRFAGPDEIKVTGPLTTEEVEQLRQRLSG
ncbi:MAG: hypothetical protein WD078_15675 [Woeseia sp.]